MLACVNPQSLLACRSMLGWAGFSPGWLAQPTESRMLSLLGLSPLLLAGQGFRQQWEF